MLPLRCAPLCVSQTAEARVTSVVTVLATPTLRVLRALVLAVLAPVRAAVLSSVAVLDPEAPVTARLAAAVVATSAVVPALARLVEEEVARDRPCPCADAITPGSAIGIEIEADRESARENAEDRAVPVRAAAVVPESALVSAPDHALHLVAPNDPALATALDAAHLPPVATATVTVTAIAIVIDRREDPPATGNDPGIGIETETGIETGRDPGRDPGTEIEGDTAHSDEEENEDMQAQGKA